MKNPDKTYVIITAAAFATMFAVLNFFPRSTFSERERRDLAKFPKMETQALWNGNYAREISAWYSDSEPFRDKFLTISEIFQHYKGISINAGGEQVNYIATGSQNIEDPGLLAGSDDEDDNDDNIESNQSDNAASATSTDADTTKPADAPSDKKTDAGNQQVETDANFSTTNSGVMLVGKEPNVRAMMCFGCSAAYVKKYTSAVNKYKETFPNVEIWVMPIPISIEFYCPEEAKSCTWPQIPCLNAVKNNLDEGVHYVDIYPTLLAHKDEAIYLRTDHHWAPLGGFYAAEQFAKDAGLTFPSREEGYTEKVVHGFVGTMYGYSHNISVKKSPEDFVYYYPNTDFTTYVTAYDLDESFKIVKQHAERKGSYFAKFKDGSSGAYCTFMGSDKQITRVETKANNGRRIIILKDSFGNTLPSCLFYSFEEVHVIDYRYFTLNMQEYVEKHHITDILFANNLTFCVTGHAGKAYTRFLTQGGGGKSNAPAKDTTKIAVPAKDTAKVVVPAKDTIKEDIPAKDTVQ